MQEINRHQFKDAVDFLCFYKAYDFETFPKYLWFDILKYFPLKDFEKVLKEWIANNDSMPHVSHIIDLLEKHYEGCRKVYLNAKIRLLTDYDGRYSEFEGYKEEDTLEQKSVIFDGEIEKRQVGITDCIKYLDLIAKIRRGDF